MKDLLLAVLNSEAMQGLIVMVVGWVMVKVYAKIPKAQTFMDKYRGEMIRAVKMVEKAIQPDSPNKGLRRLDAALVYVIGIIEAAEKRKLSATEIAVIRSNISEVHNDVLAPELGS
jgi:hypothetical protein